MNARSRLSALVLIGVVVMASGGVITVGSSVASAANAGSCTTITATTTIEQSGCYVLENSLTGLDDDGIVINASNVVFDGDGHTIDGRGNDGGIVVAPGTSNVTIENVSVTQFGEGIEVYRASDITIRDSQTKENYYGIKIYDSAAVRVERVTHRYDIYTGIEVEDSTNVHVSNAEALLDADNAGFSDYAVDFYHSTGSLTRSTLAANDTTVRFNESPGALIDAVTATAREDIALDIEDSPGVVVRDSQFRTGPDWDTAEIDGSPDARVLNNTFTDGEYGLRLSDSQNSTVRNNAINGSRWGLRISNAFRHDIDTTNTVDGEPVHYRVGLSGETITDVSGGYYAIVDSTDITVSGVQSPGRGQGLVLAHVDGLTVESSTFDRDYTGLTVFNSTTIEIRDVDVSGSNTGIFLDHSDNATLASIVASLDTESKGGVLLSGSHDVTVMDGTFRRMGIRAIESDRLVVRDSSIDRTGIETFRSNDLLVEDSEFTSTGFQIRDFSDRATVRNNTFDDARNGLEIGSHSDDAVVYANTFRTIGGDSLSNSDGDAISIHASSNTIVRNNTVVDAEESGIVLSRTRGTIVENNSVASTGQGLSVHTGNTVYTRDFLIRNNVFEDGHRGIVLYQYTRDGRIEGNSFTNLTSHAIYLPGHYYSGVSSNVTVTDNEFRSISGYGVGVEEAEHYTVTNNTFVSAQGLAVAVIDGTGVSITHNDIVGFGRPGTPQQRNGAITLDGARNTTVRANVLESSHTGFHLKNLGPNTVVRNNRVSNASFIGIWGSSNEGAIIANEIRRSNATGIKAGGYSSPEMLLVADNVVTDSGDVGIDTTDMGVLLRNNTLRDNEAGVDISGNAGGAHGPGIVVEGNRITGTVNGSALFVHRADNGEITNNDLRDNRYGIAVSATQDFDIVNNTVENSTIGVWLGRTFSDISHRVDGGYRYSWFRESADNRITGNQFIDVDQGFHVFLVPDALLSEENGLSIRTDTTIGLTGITVRISIEEGEGDTVTEVVGGPSVINNTIANNHVDAENAFVRTYGVGPALRSMYDETLSPNIWNRSTTTGPNVVDGPSIGGNYWSNASGTGFSETCTDGNADGFCDAPLEFAANNSDALPLAAGSAGQSEPPTPTPQPPATPTPPTTPAPSPTATPTPDRGSGSGGSGGGSSDSGQSAAPTKTTVTQSSTGGIDVAITNARSGTQVTIDGHESGTRNVSLDGLDVTPLVDGDFTLNVSLSEGPPAGAPATAPSGETPIGYLSVDHSIPDEDIGEVTFHFRVSKASLAARGLAPGDVVVYRHHDGQWQAASMSVVDETADHYRLAATVPGLSVFAVGTLDAAMPTPEETPAATPTDAGSGTPSPNNDAGRTPADDAAAAPTAEGLSRPVLVALVVAVGLAGTLLLLRRNRE